MMDKKIASVIRALDQEIRLARRRKNDEDIGVGELAYIIGRIDGLQVAIQKIKESQQ